MADWHVLHNDAPRVWSALNRGLAGSTVRWSRNEHQSWYAYGERHAASIADGYDVVVVHDPQALVLGSVLGRSASGPRWVWHCHTDVRNAQADVWAEVRRAARPFDLVLFPSEQLTRSDLDNATVGVARPSLDPCAPKNVPLEPRVTANVLQRLGIDSARPLFGQFSPITQGHTPVAALGAYWLACRQIPELQFVLVEGSAPVDRTPRDVEQAIDAARDDARVHVLPFETGLGATELNALQRSVLGVVQLAAPCGFAWGVAECQWKGRPAIVSRAGCLEEQVAGGSAGLIVESAVEAADTMVRIARDPVLAEGVGRRGREHVGREHLATSLLTDYVRALRRVTSADYRAEA
jgi:trehalose synthase